MSPADSPETPADAVAEESTPDEPTAAEVLPGGDGDAARTAAVPRSAPAPDPLLPPGPRRSSGWPRIVAAAALFFLVVSLPLWVGQSSASFLVDLTLLVALAQWWGLLAGFGGTPSLAGGFYAGAGTYAWLALVQGAGLNPVVAAAVAAASTAALAVPSGWLLLRLAPAWTALGGLILAAAAAQFVSVVDSASVDGRTVSAVTALGSTLRRSLTTWLAVVIGVGSVVAVVAVRRSRIGLAVVAYRDDPEVAATLGVRANWARLAVWVMAAAAAGMAGAVLSFRSGSVSVAGAFDPLVWVLPALVAAALGGMRSLSGPVIGAFVYVVLERLFGVAAALALCSIGAAVLMVTVPRGLADHAVPAAQRRLDPLLASLRRNLGLRPAGAHAAGARTSRAKAFASRGSSKKAAEEETGRAADDPSSRPPESNTPTAARP